MDFAATVSGPWIEMRTVVRSLCHFRLAFRHSKYNYSGGFVRTHKCLIETNTGTVCKLASNAEFERFQGLEFMISRAMSVDAAHATNKGFFFKHISGCH